MKKSSVCIFIGGIILCGASVATGAFLMASNNEYERTGWSFQAPPGATADEVRQVAENYAMFGTPLPAGWSLASYDGKTEGFRTGRVLPDGKEQILLTLSNDLAADIDRAELWIDGQLAFTANRTNGSIVDTPSGPIATMTGFVANPGSTIEARWWDTGNVMVSEELTLANLPSG